MSNFKPNFSEGLKRARKNAGYKTQQDFADALPKSLNAVQKWEQGKTFPSLGEFIDLCQFFGCDADYLLGNIENVTHDLDFVCKYTGLSAEAVFMVSQSKSEWFDSFLAQYSYDICSRFLSLGLTTMTVETTVLACKASNMVSEKPEETKELLYSQRRALILELFEYSELFKRIQEELFHVNHIFDEISRIECSIQKPKGAEDNEQ